MTKFIFSLFLLSLSFSSTAAELGSTQEDKNNATVTTTIEYDRGRNRHNRKNRKNRRINKKRKRKCKQFGRSVYAG